MGLISPCRRVVPEIFLVPVDPPTDPPNCIFTRGDSGILFLCGLKIEFGKTCDFTFCCVFYIVAMLISEFLSYMLCAFFIECAFYFSLFRLNGYMYNFLPYAPEG